MVIVMCKFPIPAAQREAYYHDLETVLGVPSRKDPGCLQYDYFYPAGRDDMIVLLERWENEELLNAHLNTPHCKMAPVIREKYGATAEFQRFVTVD